MPVVISPDLESHYEIKTRKTAVAAMVGTALFAHIASAQEADVESEQEARKT